MEALSILLFLFGLALVVAEVIIPGVVMGLIGAAAMIGGIYVGWEAAPSLAMAELALAVIGIPVIAMWGIRRMRLKTEIEAPEETEDLSGLVGKEGDVLNDLKPSGFVSIDGKKYTAHSQEGYIDRGSRVSVVKVEGTRIFVRTN